jgi:hypothetical protein
MVGFFMVERMLVIHLSTSWIAAKLVLLWVQIAAKRLGQTMFSKKVLIALAQRRNHGTEKSAFSIKWGRTRSG